MDTDDVHERRGPRGAGGTTEGAIMACLRHETRAEHVALEQTPFAVALGAGQLTMSQYVALLRCYLPIYRTLEATLAGCAEPSVLAVYRPERAKAPRIESDLAHLPGSGAAAVDALVEGAGGSIATLQRTIQSAGGAPARLLGQLYVFEGSTLGARMILPRLQACLGLDDTNTGYFRGYGGETLARWGQFTEAMNHAAATPEAQEQAVVGARETFVGLRALFVALGPLSAPS
jgi:heme oxygenase